MKQIKYYLLTLAVLLCTTACNNANKKIEKQIPADASVVVKLNTSELCKHCGIDLNKEKFKFPTKFLKVVNSDYREFQDLVKILPKMMESGIDYFNDSYGFVPNGALNDRSDFDFVAMIPLKDAGKMKAFLEDDTDVNLKTKDDMQIELDGKRLLIIKGDILYIAITNDESKNEEDAAANLFSLLLPDKNMTEKPAIVKALGSNDDVNVYVDSKKIKKHAIQFITKILFNDDQELEFYADEDNGSSEEEMILVSSLLDMWDAQSTAIHMNLANNECRIRCENEFSENSEFLELANRVMAKPNADILNIIPRGDGVRIMSICINGKAVMELDMVKKYLNEVPYDDGLAYSLTRAYQYAKGPIIIADVVNKNNDINSSYNSIYAFKCTRDFDLDRFIRDLPDFPTDAVRMGNEYVIKGEDYEPTGFIGTKDNIFYMRRLYAVINTNMTKDEAYMSQDKEFVNIIGNAVFSYCISVDDDNNHMHLSFQSQDMKDSEASLWVSEDGTKLPILDAIATAMEILN